MPYRPSPKIHPISGREFRPDEGRDVSWRYVYANADNPGRVAWGEPYDAAIADLTAMIGPIVDDEAFFDADLGPIRPTRRRSPLYDAPRHEGPRDVVGFDRVEQHRRDFPQLYTEED